MKKAAVIIGAALWMSLIPVGSAQRNSPKERDPDISFILDRTAEYCDRLSRAVLDFVCRERIEQYYYSLNPGVRRLDIFDRRPLPFINRWEYDYQLIRDPSGRIRETRVLLKRGHADVRVEDAALETHIVRFRHVVMGPLDLLSRANQALHDYTYLGEEEIGGESAIVIEAVPKPGVSLGHHFGRISVRTEDAGILKIQWNPRSIGNYAQVEEIGRSLDMTPSISIVSEFAFEKNGIHFPSRFLYKEIYSRKNRRFQRAETEVIYDQYKFFTVSTDAVLKEPASR